MKFVDWADGRTLSAVSVEEAQVYLNTARIGSYNHYLRFTKASTAGRYLRKLQNSIRSPISAPGG